MLAHHTSLEDQHPRNGIHIQDRLAEALENPSPPRASATLFPVLPSASALGSASNIIAGSAAPSPHVNKLLLTQVFRQRLRYLHLHLEQLKQRLQTQVEQD